MAQLSCSCKKGSCVRCYGCYRCGCTCGKGNNPIGASITRTRKRRHSRTVEYLHIEPRQAQPKANTQANSEVGDVITVRRLCKALNISDVSLPGDTKWNMHIHDMDDASKKRLIKLTCSILKEVCNMICPNDADRLMKEVIIKKQKM